MPKGRRPAKQLSKKYTVYCEGKTESRYLEGLRTWMKESHPEIKLRLEPVDVGGGGYREFLKRLRIEPDTNCVARFVLLDYDRVVKHAHEAAAFKELLDLSQASTRKNVPIILIVSNESFEYALCAHDPKYRDGDTEAHLTDCWAYRDFADVKSDGAVWNRAHTLGRSHEVAIRHLMKRPQLITNTIRYESKKLRLSLIEVRYDSAVASTRTSNLTDLFIALGIVADIR